MGQQLRGSWVWEQALVLYRHIVRQYCYLHTRIKAGVLEGASPMTAANFTLADFRWAVCTVMSRQNSMPLKRETGEHLNGLCLVPLWDMMNHKQLEPTTSFDPDVTALVFSAAEDVAKGSQVFMFYGPRGNEEFLLYQ